MTASGPSSPAAGRALNRSSCGSCSKVGNWNGGSLLFSNAHVLSAQIGRNVRVEFLINGQKETFPARVIEAMYSDRVTADWAMAFCEDPLPDVPVVNMSKKMVKKGMDLYTRGCPRCVWPPVDSDVDIFDVRTDGGVAWWDPNSIGGQSGSAVWSDIDHYMWCLLTWSWQRGGRWRGAGQPTAFIYEQARTIRRTGAFLGHKRPDGLIVPEFPENWAPDWDTSGLDDPVLPTVDTWAIDTDMNIRDYPIWEGDNPPVEPPPTEPPSDDKRWLKDVEFYRSLGEQYLDHARELEGLPSTIVDKPNNPPGQSNDNTFGL